MAASDSSYAQHYMIEHLLGGQMPMSTSGTDQLFPLGLTVRAIDMNTLSTKTAASMTISNLGAGEFVYCRGSNVASRGQFVHIINNSAVLLASANSASFYPIGLAGAPLTATNCYGWVQVAGIADYATCSNTDVAANGRIALGSTAGQVGTVTALGSRIQGIVVPVSYTAARSASAPNLTVQLNHPRVIGITGSN